MSGGHFDYMQYRINDITDEIDELIKSNNDANKNEWGGTVGRFYDPDIIERFKEASHCLKQAAEMAQRIDWLVSNDDSEDSFKDRWMDEVRDYYIAT